MKITSQQVDHAPVTGTAEVKSLVTTLDQEVEYFREAYLRLAKTVMDDEIADAAIEIFASKTAFGLFKSYLKE